MLDRIIYLWAMIWGRDNCAKYALKRLKEREKRLTQALQPILNHAKAPDVAPPLKFSVDAAGPSPKR